MNSSCETQRCFSTMSRWMRGSIACPPPKVKAPIFTNVRKSCRHETSEGDSITFPFFEEFSSSREPNPFLNGCLSPLRGEQNRFFEEFEGSFGTVFVKDQQDSSPSSKGFSRDLCSCGRLSFLETRSCRSSALGSTAGFF